jgi:hypothetical protein
VELTQHDPELAVADLPVAVPVHDGDHLVDLPVLDLVNRLSD